MWITLLKPRTAVYVLLALGFIQVPGLIWTASTGEWDAFRIIALVLAAVPVAVTIVWFRAVRNGNRWPGR